MIARLIFVAVILLLAGGCSLPIPPEQIPAFVEALAKDNASACALLGAGGGAGGIAITPTPSIPMGGGGYAALTVCRTNQPGTVILVKANGEITILHGVYKQEVDQKELELLREMPEKFWEIPKIMILPGPKPEPEEEVQPQRGTL